MHAAVSAPGGAVNAAVWDGAAVMPEAERGALARWCSRGGFSLNRKKISPGRDFRALSRLFSQVAAGEADRAVLAPLEDHIRGRLRAMGAAFPGWTPYVSVRASLQETRNNVRPGGALHVDSAYGSFYNHARLIEAVCGPAVCLIDDGQVAFRGRNGRVKMADVRLVFWQVATGSLSLITSAGNSLRPVVHSPPPQEQAGADGGARVVVIYDLVQEPVPLWRRMVGLFR